MDPSFGSEIAFITGSSSGIGAAIARKFALAGTDVVLNYRKTVGESQEQGELLCRGIEEVERRAYLIQANTAVKASVKYMFSGIREKCGRLDSFYITYRLEQTFGIHISCGPSGAHATFAMLGHTIGAAAANEAILTLVGIYRSIILPTIDYEFSDPKSDLDYVPNEARRTEHCRALSNSFGFGGQNACLCIGQYDATDDAPALTLDTHAA
ncbi:MAG TPA: hypothetical protein DCP92_02240 [Nitrospiraceae bacterium]|jgi:hypothetical protein|nr:hypothetical protein [Nitrospiraceae bacterium]